jgi:hypothetical protein
VDPWPPLLCGAPFLPAGDSPLPPHRRWPSSSPLATAHFLPVGTLLSSAASVWLYVESPSGGETGRGRETTDSEEAWRSGQSKSWHAVSFHFPFVFVIFFLNNGPILSEGKS